MAILKREQFLEQEIAAEDRPYRTPIGYKRDGADYVAVPCDCGEADCLGWRWVNWTKLQINQWVAPPGCTDLQAANAIAVQHGRWLVAEGEVLTTAEFFVPIRTDEGDMALIRKLRNIHRENRRGVKLSVDELDLLVRLFDSVAL